jgi:undecaprenyl-diphosphatase
MKKMNYYAIGILLLIISLIFDNQIIMFFTSFRIEFLNDIAIFINDIEGYMLFAFVLVILFIAKQKKKIIPLMLTFLLYLGLATLIKNIVLRPRPFSKFNFQIMVDEPGINKSFPSGHATASSATIPFFRFNKSLMYIWIFIVAIVGLSRVYLGVHYLSDVIAGFILGYLIGDLSIMLIKLRKNRHRKV